MRLGASGMPCIYLFRLSPQAIVCIRVMQQLNLAHLRVPSKLGVKFCIGWGEFHNGVPRQMFMSPGGVYPLDTATGGRILVSVRVEQEVSSPVTLVLNWDAEMKQ